MRAEISQLTMKRPMIAKASHEAQFVCQKAEGFDGPDK
jgi:hypothetical protein